MADFFLTDDGLKIAFDVKGEGVPLLCLAGLTRNMDDFQPVVDHFSDRATVIRIDSRGRGASDFDPDFMNYSLAQEARDAIAVLDFIGFPRAAILGTSRGGLIAMLLAATAKPRLRGVLLNDIGPVVAPRGLAAIMDYLGRPSAYRSYDDAAEKLPRALGAAFPGVTTEQWRTYATRIWKEGPRRLELRYDPKIKDAVVAQSATGATPNLWPLFDAFEGIPLALLRGENTDILSNETVEEMLRRRPDLIYSDVRDRGHVPFLDEPESLDVISRFIDAVDAGN